MDDADLARYLGIEAHPQCADIIARLPVSRRASYERMAKLEIEINEWLAGNGPYPDHVHIDWAPGKKAERFWQ